MTLPLFARKFIVDFVETALGLVFGLALLFPQSGEDLRGIGIVVGGALLAAGVSAARRAIPGLLLWLNEKLNLPNEEV